MTENKFFAKDADMDSSQALSLVERFIAEGLSKLSEALSLHIPFGITKDKKFIKYIPERCLTTYFANTLINNGFIVFNEHSYSKKNGEAGTAKLDLLARKINPVKDEAIQLMVEAKGNLDAGYESIVADITRMKERHPDSIIGSGFEYNKPEDEFGHKFNIVLTTDWGYKEFSTWWLDNEDAPSIKDHDGDTTKTRKVHCWKPLKDELRHARRGVHHLVTNTKHHYSVNALYAIFSK